MPCHTRRAMTESGSSCRLLACSRSWAVLVPGQLMRLVGPLGSTGHRRDCARGSRQCCGDDARAALLFQPPGGWTSRRDGPGHGADLLLGRSRRPTHADGFPNTPEPATTIQFATFPTSWLYLRRLALYQIVWPPIDQGRPKWYVLQNRPGAFFPLDRIIGHAWPCRLTPSPSSAFP